MAASTGVTQTSTPSPTSVLAIAFGPDKAAEVEAHVRECFAAAHEASDLFGAAINAAREAELKAARLFAEAHEQKQLAVTLGVIPARDPARLSELDMPDQTYILGKQLNAAMCPERAKRPPGRPVRPVPNSKEVADHLVMIATDNGNALTTAERVTALQEARHWYC